MSGEQQAIVRYRLDRAREAADEAQLLLEAGHTNTYVSRLYYACYYAVSALLLADNTPTSRHSQVRALLHQRFVKPGKVQPAMGRHFDRLFDTRQKSDYADFAEFRAEEVADWLGETRDFVACIGGLAEQRLGGPDAAAEA